MTWDQQLHALPTEPAGYHIPGSFLNHSHRLFWQLLVCWICYPQGCHCSTVHREHLFLPSFKGSVWIRSCVFMCYLCILSARTWQCSFVAVHQWMPYPGIRARVGKLGMAGRHRTGVTWLCPRKLQALFCPFNLRTERNGRDVCRWWVTMVWLEEESASEVLQSFKGLWISMA